MPPPHLTSPSGRLCIEPATDASAIEELEAHTLITDEQLPPQEILGEHIDDLVLAPLSHAA